jgi:hypothetical protein
MFLRTYLTNDNHLVLDSQMNLHLVIHMKELNPLIIGMMIIIVTLCATATFFFAPNFGSKAYAQENNNNNNNNNDDDDDNTPIFPKVYSNKGYHTGSTPPFAAVPYRLYYTQPYSWYIESFLHQQKSTPSNILSF